MDDNELKIILTLQDKVTKEFEGVVNKIKSGSSEMEKSQDKLGKKSNESNKSIVDGIKGQQREMVSLVRMVTRVGFIWGATFGIMIKSVLDLGKEIDNLDRLSIKLGISTSDLSIKFYGFDITANNAKVGVASLQNTFGGFGETLLKIKMGIASVIAEQDILIRQGQGLGNLYGAYSIPPELLSKMPSQEDAIAQIQQENLAKRMASKEGQELLIAEDILFNQLSMSKVEYTRYQFGEQIKLMQLYGVDTQRLQREFSIREAQDEEILLFQLAAQRYQAEGNITAYLENEYNARLMQFKKVNDSERAVAAFTATEEIKFAEKIKQAKLQQFQTIAQGLQGLSNALTAYAGENKKAAKAAAAVALASAIVTGASVILNALETKPFIPVGLAMGALATMMTGVQIATIASQGFAMGGRPPVGTPSLVGERGPELFMPDTSGTIIPNNRLGGYFNQTSIHIEVNNPTIRSDEDIDKLTEEISLRLAREAERL